MPLADYACKLRRASVRVTVNGAGATVTMQRSVFSQARLARYLITVLAILALM